MSTAIVVAIISGVVSLLAAGVSYFNSVRLARLNDQLEEQRREKTKAEQAAELRARYRDPLLNSVFDLQSRLYNIVAQTFLIRYAAAPDEASRIYAVQSTLYVIAEYLAWVEVIRREIQFLDLGDQLANREWVTELEKVRNTLARDDIDPVLRIFRGEQRAIGELMALAATGSDGSQHLECLGYATFVGRLSDPGFSRWFAQLKGNLALLVKEPDIHLERLVLLQNALVDLLDLLDPDCDRFAAERRGRLATALGDRGDLGPAPAG